MSPLSIDKITSSTLPDVDLIKLFKNRKLKYINQCRVYLILNLTYSKDPYLITVKELITKSKIHRPIIYDIIKDYENKGLLLRIKKEPYGIIISPMKPEFFHNHELIQTAKITLGLR